MAPKPTGSFQDGLGKVVQQISGLGMLPDSTPDDVQFCAMMQQQFVEYSKTRASNPMPGDGMQGQQGGMMGGMGAPQGPPPMGGGMGGAMQGLTPGLTDMNEIAKMLGGPSNMNQIG
jgi:hypothetical protein